MTQRKIEYYSKPISLYDNIPHSPKRAEEEIVFYLISRILRLMAKFKMKSQGSISQRSVRECATRLVSETRNLHG